MDKEVGILSYESQSALQPISFFLTLTLAVTFFIDFSYISHERLTEEVKSRMKEFYCPRYKIVCFVLIGQNLGQSIKYVLMQDYESIIVFLNDMNCDETSTSLSINIIKICFI